MTAARIEVVDADPRWPQQFDALHAKLWPRLEPHALAIEHVGSTSVPGLSAKPIIDLAVVVADASKLREAIDALADCGYAHRGDLGVPGREAFTPSPSPVSHHLYACVSDNLGLRNHLALRDALRQDSDLAAAYGSLKKQLAQRFPHDIDAYIDGKTGFILDILSRSGFTEDELDAIRGVNEN